MKTLVFLTTLVAMLGMGLPVRAQPTVVVRAGPWRTDRPFKAVVIGGSISMYYAGNFGQYLQYGCKDLEVLNKGKVGAGGAELARIFREQVLADRAVMAPLTRTTPQKKGNAWVLFQGGLNSVGTPDSTAWFLSRLFDAAHAAGFQVLALSLTPWGSDDDPRFVGWRGLRMVRATEQVVDYVMGRLNPQQACGVRAKGHAEAWQACELPDVGVDLYHSPLRAGGASALRSQDLLEASFSSGGFGRFVSQKQGLIAAAQAVPQSFLDQKYRDFDHVHPNGAGHRLIAALVCQQAPIEWGCDCDAIRHSSWKGRVLAGK
jgi:hypothetical protein